MKKPEGEKNPNIHCIAYVLIDFNFVFLK